MKKSFEGYLLCVLSLMLVCVFVFSVYMYDDIAVMSENGTLFSAATALRSFIDESEAVAAFLGIDRDSDTEITDSDISKQVMAYIERYNEIYSGLK